MSRKEVLRKSMQPGAPGWEVEVEFTRVGYYVKLPLDVLPREEVMGGVSRHLLLRDNPEAQRIAEENREEMLEFLQELTRLQSTILSFCFGQGLSETCVAGLVGKNRNQVHGIKVRTMAKLRKKNGKEVKKK